MFHACQGVYLTPWQCTLSYACHAKAAEAHACHAKEPEPQGTLGRTSALPDPLAMHIVPRLPRKRGGAPRDARAYIRPLGNAHCSTPATQKRRSPKGRQGVHPRGWMYALASLGAPPWQCRLSHACHAKAAEPQGTPARTSNPLAVHLVPRLPRKRGGAPRDARAYIQPLGSADCPTPATQKRRSPKGRQGVHPTPWQYTLSHACHAKEAEPQGTPGRTSDPLALHIVPRLPRKSGGAPRDARAYIRPLGSAHCRTPATQKRRSPKGRQGVHSLGNAHCPTPATQKRRSPKGRQGVHPTPWQCRLSRACHAKEAEPQGTPGRTSDPLAVHIVPRLPRKSGGAPRDARAYIQPLGSADCPTPATQKRRSPKGRQGVHQTPWQCTLSHAWRSPKGRQRVHPTPWQCTLSHACHAKEAEPQGTPGRTSNPLAVQIVSRLPRKSGGAPRDARAYIQPLGSTHCPTPATQKRRSPKGRQGVHQTPWHCTLSHACHAKAAEPQGTPGRTSDPLAVHIVARLPHKRGGAPRDARAYIPLAVHIVPRLPRKSGGAPRDARAYIQPLGSADCPAPATQKRRSPKGRQGVHQTPWQCTLSHACHAKAAEPQGTPGRTSNPLAVQIVQRLPRKSGGAPRDARAYIKPLGSAHCPTPGGAPRDARAYIRPLGSAPCPTPATQKRRSPKGRQGVHPTPWQCTLSHACHAKAAEPQGTPGRTSDPLAVHIVPRLPRKSGGAPRDARAYIRPLGSAHCPTPATQKRRSPKGRQGVHPTPWQCTLCHACHAKVCVSE